MTAFFQLQSMVLEAVQTILNHPSLITMLVVICAAILSLFYWVNKLSHRMDLGFQRVMDSIQSLRQDLVTVDQSIRKDLATVDQSIRKDLANLEQSTRKDLVTVDQSLRQEMQSGFKHLEIKMDYEFKMLRLETNHRFERSETRIDRLEGGPTLKKI